MRLDMVDIIIEVNKVHFRFISLKVRIKKKKKMNFNLIYIQKKEK
jgi:hypothetical protein